MGQEQWGRPDLRDCSDLRVRDGILRKHRFVHRFAFFLYVLNKSGSRAVCRRLDTPYAVAERWIVGCMLRFAHARSDFSDTLQGCPSFTLFHAPKFIGHVRLIADPLVKAHASPIDVAAFRQLHIVLNGKGFPPVLSEDEAARRPAPRSQHITWGLLA